MAVRAPLLSVRSEYVKENAREPYQLPVPQSEALVLPGKVERTNLQKPHAVYVSTYRQPALTRLLRQD